MTLIIVILTGGDDKNSVDQNCLTINLKFLICRVNDYTEHSCRQNPFHKFNCNEFVLRNQIYVDLHTIICKYSPGYKCTFEKEKRALFNM